MYRCCLIILGIDPALAHTGAVVFDTNTFEILWQGTITNPPGSSRDGVVPFVRIRDAVKAIIVANRVEKVYIERMFQSRNPMVTEVLFIAAFMTKLACHDMGIPCSGISIMGKDGWKNFALGKDYTKAKGNLAKGVTRRATEAALGVKFGSEHSADAGSIALAGWYLETGVDFRTVLGVPIPEGVGMTPAKPKGIGGRKRRASKPRKSDSSSECIS